MHPPKLIFTFTCWGRRSDGYHIIESLVGFTRFADKLQARPSSEWTLTLSGPEANHTPAGESNLILQAVRAMPTGSMQPLAFELEKHLPIEAGLGGGSSDAVAALRLMNHFQTLPIGPRHYGEIARCLGSDLPVCLAAKPSIVTGLGECIAPAILPDLPIVLVNPRIRLATSQVFAAWSSIRPHHDSNNASIALRPETDDIEDLTAWLAHCRNDLEPAAQQIVPEIGDVLAQLMAAPRCLLARMSGSGATCFGIFRTELAAHAAAHSLSSCKPHWWISPTQIIGSKH